MLNSSSTIWNNSNAFLPNVRGGIQATPKQPPFVLKLPLLNSLRLAPPPPCPHHSLHPVGAKRAEALETYCSELVFMTAIHNSRATSRD